MLSEERIRRNIAQNERRLANRKERNEYERLRREKNKDEINAKKRQPEIRAKLNEGVKSWRKRNRHKFQESQKAYKKKNKIELNARNLVYKHIRRGKMFRGTKCEICNCEGKIEAHHDDYSKPLNVRWLCRTCHKKEHGKLLDVK